MPKNTINSSTREFKTIQTLFEKRLQNLYDQCLNWKFILAILPLSASFVFNFNAKETTKPKTLYLTSNLQSFTNTKFKQQRQTRSYEANQKSFLTPYQLSKVLQENYKKSSPVASVPLFLNGVSENATNTNGEGLSTLRLYSIRKLFLPTDLDIPDTRTKTPSEQTLTLLGNYNAEQISNVLKSKSILSKYQFSYPSNLTNHLRFSSGQQYKNQESPVANLTSLMNENRIDQKNPDFINKHSSKLLLPEASSLNLQIQIDKNTTLLNNRVLINNLTNDLIVNNPHLLHHLLKRLQQQASFQDFAFDFFGGSIRRRQKYNLCAVDIKDNPFYYDLNTNLNPLNRTENDRLFLLSRSEKNFSKYPTTIRTLQNRIGNSIQTSPLQKTGLEIGMVNGDTKNNLFIILPTPLSSQDFETNLSGNKLALSKAFDSTREYSTIFQYFPTIFSSNTKTKYISDNYAYLGEYWWLGVTQLSIVFFLFQLLKKLYGSYQYELGLYLSEFASRLNMYDEDIKSLIENVTNSSSIRVFTNLQMSFLQLGGVIELLPKFGETVLFLKNKCRPTTKTVSLPKAILLVGPPGTGKTLLVKAIGAEANVPVLIQSGNGILEESDGINKLQEAFKKAKELSPCILFIDEMDSIGVKRSELSLSLYQSGLSSEEELLVLRSENKVDTLQTQNTRTTNSSPEQVQALTQLLVELDGVEKRRGFVVFGATNRRESLDPALIRPGRFNDIIEIGLPNQQKRIEILKIYTQNLGFDTTMDWNSYSRKTVGCSAADLATIVNKSTIQSIIQNRKHTNSSLLESFLKTKNTTDNFVENVQLDSFSFLRLSYYENARQLIQSHVIKKNRLIQYLVNEIADTNLYRSFEISHREKVIDQIKQKIYTFNPRGEELLLWLLVELAGKAGESILLNQNTSSTYNSNLSTIGEIDLFRATIIAECYFEILQISPKLTKIKQQSPKNIVSTSIRSNNTELNDFTAKQYWKIKTNAISILGDQVQNPMSRRWYRIHLGNPEVINLNEEILFADLYQPEIESSFGDCTSEIAWNDLTTGQRDLQIQLLLTTIYHKSLLFLELNREILDQTIFAFLKEQKHKNQNIIR